MDHSQFKEAGIEALKEMYGGFTREKILIDVKGIYDKTRLEEIGINW